jgi:hypothetical protein
VHAVVLAGPNAPGRQVSVVAKDAYVGDLLGHDVLQLELAYQGDVVVAGGQVPTGIAVLVGIAGTV